jgi:hypothetical protein
MVQGIALPPVKKVRANLSHLLRGIAIPTSGIQKKRPNFYMSATFNLASAGNENWRFSE